MKLAILPYVPSALHSEPALELPAMDWTAPKGCSSTLQREDAGGGRCLSDGQCRKPQESQRPGEAIIGVRIRLLQIALLCTCSCHARNLALLVYLG